MLVHCYAGVSRSATTVIAYLMVEKGAGFIDAANFVRKRRPIIFPNTGFQKQLAELEKYLKEADNDNESIISKISKKTRQK